MLNFCTLFNSSYLVYGLCLYNSLLQKCPNFHLYIYAFDVATHDYFLEKKLPYITIIKLEEFEDEQLLAIKPGRSFGEYCWTCTSSIILHAINKFQLPSCTYVDADLYFFSSPQPLLDEMGDNSVLITEHRYTPRYDQSSTSGIYCVQFMVFKNDENGMKVLNWWRNACLEWCFDRFEDGKFGDQKYLDDWLTKFEGVHSLQHLGGGVAPWNVQQYDFCSKEKKIIGIDRESGIEFPLVFFHFHGMKFLTKNLTKLTNEVYLLSANVRKHIYAPYLKKIFLISEKEPKFSFFSKLPESHLHKIPFMPLYMRIKLQYLINTAKLKQYYRLFSGGNYYFRSVFK